MSGFEIERKFLVRGDGFKMQAESSSHIRQGYIISGDGRTVRVRTRDGRGFLTIKGPAGNGGLARYEFEKEITADEAEHLMQMCEPGVVDKRRYIVPFHGHVFEVDEFFGDNDGLVFAEVELGSEDEAFDKPDFIGPEVTGDRHFYNSNLRRMPYRLWCAAMPEEYRHRRQG